MLRYGGLYRVLHNFPLQVRTAYIKKSELYMRCYAILGVKESSDQNTVRKAYIELVKKVHPDSGFPEASAEKFQEVDNAFRILQEKFAKNRRGIDDDEMKVFDIRHTAPQHRQYLNFDGIGVGTPFQRQKQYQQHRAGKAQANVLEHRVQKAQAGEQALMKKEEHYKTHGIKTKYGFDRVVEDLIQEAMSKGDFNNLSGAGKPLSHAQSQNPYIDFTTHKLNKILLDNGFTPEWITLQREIREDIQALMKNIAAQREYFGDIPLNESEETKWMLIIDTFKSDVERINKNVDKYNLIVPILENQMFRIKLDKIANSILNDEKLPRNKIQEETTNNNREINRHESSSHGNFLTFLGSLF